MYSHSSKFNNRFFFSFIYISFALDPLRQSQRIQAAQLLYIIKVLLFPVELFSVIVVAIRIYRRIMNQMALLIIVLLTYPIIRLYNVWRISIKHIHKGKDLLNVSLNDLCLI